MFGKYSIFIDELVHIFLSFCVVGIFYVLELVTLGQGMVIFFLGILIDTDHFLNPVIGRLVGIKATIIPSQEQNGVTVKIFHGIDLYVLYALICVFLGFNFGVALCLFATLLVHHLWDFVVYDHSWRELFLITRARRKFIPGRRQKGTGLIFESETLPM